MSDWIKPIVCPSCLFASYDLDDFDCIQACYGCVFCQKCGTEFDAETGRPHEYGSCDECRYLVDEPWSLSND